jgi:hypothetical protein
LLNGSFTVTLSAQPRKGKGLRALLRELSDDEDDMMKDTANGLDVPADDPQRPWLRDFCAYMDVPEQVREGWSAIQWWGVRFQFQFSNNRKLKTL